MQNNENHISNNCYFFDYINKKNEKGFLHSHSDITEIIFVKQGSLNVYMEQEKFTLSEGDIFVINPREKHFTEGFVGTHIHIAQLGTSLISNFYMIPANIQNYLPSEKQKKMKIHSIILESLKLIHKFNSNTFDQSYIGNDIYDKTIIKLEIMKLYSLLAKFFSNTKSQRAAYLSENSETIEDFIKNNLEKNISIKDIAKLLNYSESYTGKIVKEMMCGGFKKTLNKHRIDRACDLLYDTDYSIEFISEQCGFNTTRAFYKQFSKTIGMSPSQYRKTKFKTNVTN